MKNKYCKLCNKLFNPTGQNQKYCSKLCYKLTRKKYIHNWRKNHPDYSKKYSKLHKKEINEYNKKFCKDCGKAVFGHDKNIKRCKRCSNIKNMSIRDYTGKNNPNFNNHILKGRFKGKKNPMYGKPAQSHNTKNTIVEHHIDLNKINHKKNNKLFLTHSIHSKLHQRAYEYLVKKELVRKYIKWFFKNKLNNKEKQLLQEIK